MDSIDPKNLRTDLKFYLHLATKEPIRIQRRSGESFVLMNEKLYAAMQNEILSLQRRLLGMSEAAESEGQEYKPGSRVKRLGQNGTNVDDALVNAYLAKINLLAEMMPTDDPSLKRMDFGLTVIQSSPKTDRIMAELAKEFNLPVNTVRHKLKMFQKRTKVARFWTNRPIIFD